MTPMPVPVRLDELHRRHRDWRSTDVRWQTAGSEAIPKV